MKYTDKQIQDLLDGIYNGSITEYALPDDLYFAIADYLKKGVYAGFGATVYTAAGQDLELLAELRENIYMFSAAKTFQQVKDISGLLVDSEGNLRTKREFNKLGKATYDTWNEVWGKTEYNTAVGQANQAAKWNEVEKHKSFLPYLKYSAVMDKNTSDICRPLDGIIAPVDDKIWNKIAPLNHFNCRCVLLQISADDGQPTEGNDKIAGDVEKDMDDVFKMNPGKDRIIFKEDHPYFDVEKKDKAFAKQNFGLPIPELPPEVAVKMDARTIKEAEQWALDNKLASTVSYKGLENVEFANTINRQLLELKNEYGVTYEGIKTFKQTKNGVANTLLQNHATVNKATGKYTSTLEVNKAFFNGKTMDEITAGIKDMRAREWTTAESFQDIINHEFGHRLTVIKVWEKKNISKFESLVYDYKRLGRYATKNIDETLAEIFSYYKKTGSAPAEWVAKFNKWSIVEIK